MVGDDTEYLKDTVGGALSRGVAAAIAAQPNDPVEFLGKWLHAYVANSEVQALVVAEKKASVATQQEDNARAIMQANKAAAAAAVRESALEQIAKLDGYPLDIWKKATEVIMQLCNVSSAYAAVVTAPEEPDHQWPEEEGGEDGAAAAETDDEAEDNPPKPGDGDAPEADAEGAEEGAAPPKQDVDEEAIVQPKWKYGAHHLEYVAVAPEHQSFILTKVRTLKRPSPPPDDAPDDFKPAPVPVTMRLLDESLPTLNVPCTADERRVVYFNDFPGMGGYFAAATLQRSGRHSSVLCCDTLVPHGSAQEVGARDRGFVWDVARAVAARLDEFVDARVAARASSTALEQEAALKAELGLLRGALKEGADKAAAAAAPADEAEDEKGDEAPEPEEADEGAADPAKQIEKLTRKIAKLEKEEAKLMVLKAGIEAKDAAEQACMSKIKAYLLSVQAEALKELKCYITSPRATFHVLKALFHLLQKDAAYFSTWSTAQRLITDELFSELANYDAAQERSKAVWKRVRGAYKAIKRDQMPKIFAQELPVTGLGAFAMLYIKQVRRSAIQAAALRNVDAKLAAVTDGKARAAELVTAAGQAKADAEKAKEVAEAAATASAAVDGEPEAAAAEAEAEE